jgi:hypothetical protein
MLKRPVFLHPNNLTSQPGRADGYGFFSGFGVVWGVGALAGAGGAGGAAKYASS